jgi:hypothetical protein
MFLTMLMNMVRGQPRTYKLQKSGDQYQVTVPKSIVEAKRFRKGQKFAWREDNNGNLVLIPQTG